MTPFEKDVATIQSLDAIPTILDLCCRATGMGFAAVARVTDDRWIACGLVDKIDFGMQPGGELKIETTLCNEVRQGRDAIVIEHVAEDAAYCLHPTPAMYGFQSYISVPIVLRDGTFFGTLCAIDPKPAKLKDPKILDMFVQFADLIAFHLHAADRLDAGDVIRRSDAFTRGVLAASADCIKVLSADGVIEYMNARGVELNELDSEDAVLGKEMALTWPPEERDKIRGAIRDALARGTVRVEGYCPTAKGTPRWWEASFTAFQPEEGPLKVVGVSRDITSRVDAETARRESARALRELNETLEQRVLDRGRELETAQEALRQSQKMEAVGQLTGGLAHDFNNLLTGITGSLELLEMRSAQGRSGVELQRYVSAAQGAAKRAAALTHRLLAFSRRQTLDPKPTDVNRLIGDMEDLLRRTVGAEVDIEVVGASGLWSALVDGNQLESALLNLCINARDAMPHGGRITIETANKWLDERAGKERDMPPGQYLSICVSDTGTGMTREVMERAFEPFFTTKPLGAGTGLGLSMVYGFARQSGGQVRIYSELGQGTTMCLYLPRHTGATIVIEEPAARSDLLSHDRKGTVLVVDDEPTVRMLVMEVLGDLGYDALEAVDGASALHYLQSAHAIDLLVTDVGLPGGINGRQVADAGRALRPQLKVLFITGYAENAVIGNGHLDHGMSVLTKPFPVDALAGRIRTLVGPA